MTDSSHTARDDLAFMKAVVEDKGPLPALLGMHLLALGLIFGPNLVLVWAIFTGHIGWPANLMWGTWLPGAIVYLPVNLYLHVRSRGTTWGPGARGFLAAWAAMGAMAIPTVLVLLIATAKTGLPFYEPWPALAFVLYGGAWLAVGIGRSEPWFIAIAIGCFATALGSAALITSPLYWLAQAVGTTVLLAVPGAVIVWRARAGA